MIFSLTPALLSGCFAISPRERGVIPKKNRMANFAILFFFGVIMRFDVMLFRMF